MKRSMELMAVATVVLLLGFATSLLAQESGSGSSLGQSEGTVSADVRHIPSAQGTLVIPKSSQPQPVPPGHKFAAHTNIEFYIPAGIHPREMPPFPGYGYETPASLGCVYGLTSANTGCNPDVSGLTSPTGGSKTIAIVDAYDDPDAQNDLAWFSLQFNVPLTLGQFQVVWANTAASSCAYSGVPVDPSGGWELEESLDVEWSHAMAPNAQIYLVEACSNYDTDLAQAVLVANNLVNCGQTGFSYAGTLDTTVCETAGPSSTPLYNPGEVSMSWGGGEYYCELGSNCSDYCNSTVDDPCFTAQNVVYFASSGDSPGTIYPSVSPNVVSAGGLTNRRNPISSPPYNFLQDAGWVDGGGGPSFYEAQPSYQSSITLPACHSFDWLTFSYAWMRCTPDVSFDADPYTGVYVYDTFPIYGYEYTWWVVGGTSVSSPSLAGIVNNAATKRGSWAESTTAELIYIYGHMTNTSDFTDVTSAYCGPYSQYLALVGYDLCSGIGAVKGYVGK
jgi:subtilase family serine protease